MIIKSKTKKYNIDLLSFISISILSIYSLSQLSWSILLPSNAWVFLLIISLGLMILEVAIKRKRIQADALSVLSVMMLSITLFWNNYDIKYHGYLPQFYTILLYLFFLLSRYLDKWQVILLKLMIGFGFFYTIWTYICIMIPSIYNDMVYPLMEPMGYIRDNKAGFTAFYSTNGLYISLGIIAFFCYYFLNPEKKNNLIYKIVILLLIIGMLMCGKRGQTIALIISLMIGYYVCHSNKKCNRIVKIVGVAALILFILYIVSFFIPQINTVLERFQEQSQKGDFSSGRFFMWGRAWQLFVDKPFFGRGWRYFRYSSYTLVDYDVHNVFLQLLVEVGIVGSLPFFAFIIGNVFIAERTIISACKLDTNNIEFVYLALAFVYEVFFIIMCLTGTALYQFEYMFPYFSCCSIVGLFRKKVNS